MRNGLISSVYSQQHPAVMLPCVERLQRSDASVCICHTLTGRDGQVKAALLEPVTARLKQLLHALVKSLHAGGARRKRGCHLGRDKATSRMDSDQLRSHSEASHTAWTLPSLSPTAQFTVLPSTPDAAPFVLFTPRFRYRDVCPLPVFVCVRAGVRVRVRAQDVHDSGEQKHERPSGSFFYLPYRTMPRGTEGSHIPREVPNSHDSRRLTHTARLAGRGP